MSEEARIVPTMTVEECRLMECSMWVNEENPSGELDINMKMELSDATPFTGAPSDHPMSLVYFKEHVDYSDVGGSKTPRARMEVRLRSIVSGASTDVDVLGAEAKRVAALVMYPQAQAYMAAMAGTSPMGMPRLPSLDPNEVASSLANPQ